MLHCSVLVGGLPLHVVLVLLTFSKYYKLSSFLVEFKLLVGESNRQRPCGRPKLLPPNIVVSVASAMWPGLLFSNYDPGWQPDPWLHQYVVLHQVG